ncbi:MAG: hypothetical protein KJ906_01790 [Nanoarchaeota archaeon]|nr:hypothetical protein [Nanoarchaeota archaeon]
MGDKQIRPNHINIIRVTEATSDISYIEMTKTKDFEKSRYFRFVEGQFQFKQSDNSWSDINENYVPDVAKNILFYGSPFDEVKKEYPEYTIVDDLLERVTKKK